MDKPVPDGRFDIYLNPDGIEPVTIYFKDTWWIRPEASGMAFRLKEPDCVDFYPFASIFKYRHHMNSEAFHEAMKEFQKQCDHVWQTHEDDLGMHKFEVCSECDLLFNNLAEVMDDGTTSSP